MASDVGLGYRVRVKEGRGGLVGQALGEV